MHAYKLQEVQHYHAVLTVINPYTEDNTSQTTLPQASSATVGGRELGCLGHVLVIMVCETFQARCIKKQRLLCAKSQVNLAAVWCWRQDAAGACRGMSIAQCTGTGIMAHKWGKGSNRQVISPETEECNPLRVTHTKILHEMVMHPARSGFQLNLKTGYLFPHFY